MRRRRFIAAVCAASLTRPLQARAKDDAPHVGILDPGSPGTFEDTQYWGAFREEMAALGYRDGNTVALDFRWAQGDARRLPFSLPSWS